jgi:predicted amidohydrolase YtcJ
MSRRRAVPHLSLLVALAALAACGRDAQRDPPAAAPPADLLLLNGRLTTQDEARPEASALAVRDGLVVAVGEGPELEALRGPRTKVLDAGGRRVIPGLVDSHLHAVRAGRFYALELRWDGVESLARALELVREQAARTPPGQWVRVVGGWSPFQFAERREPTVAELEAAAPGVPVFVLLLYSRAYLNRAGVAALGLTPATPVPPGSRIEFVEGGAILHADPDPALLYGTIARLPQLDEEAERRSTAAFFRELNRLGLTSAVDTGGGGHEFPRDYRAALSLATGAPGTPRLPLRLSHFLFAQVRGRELEEVRAWTESEVLGAERATDRLRGYVVAGAGENLVWAAGDFENFLAPRPELAADLERQLAPVVRALVRHRWPLRIHATYDQSITRLLDVLEPLFREQEYGARWCIDHAETVSAANLQRIRALGGGIAVQNRMAFAGEFFAARYGPAAASQAPPLRRMLAAGVPLGAGTDGTRVSSYNPWVALQWLVTGRTVGGTLLAAPENRLSRAEALRLYTLGSAWFSGEEQLKGRLAPGQFADFAVLSADYFAVPEEELDQLHSLLTVVGGDVVHAAGPFGSWAPPEPLPILPEWSPLAAGR